MKILTIPGSNSKNSISRQLGEWAATQIPNSHATHIDLNEYEMPIFSVDREEQSGPQKLAQKFLDEISKADLLIISLAEHNGSYSVAFKNVLDWASRIQGKVFQNKSVFLLATSPGARGGQSVLTAAESRFPFMGAQIKGKFSLPEFEKNFSKDSGITNPNLLSSFRNVAAGLMMQGESKT